MKTIPNYITGDLFYNSQRTAVYRGIHYENGKKVIIKYLNSEHPDPLDIAKFEREYELTKRLEHIDGTPKLFGFEKIGNSAAIIFKDNGATALSENSLNLESKIEAAVGTAQILSEIHGTNVIHKDINPANIIRNPDTRKITIIDFEIASELPKENPEIKSPDVLECTLAYMSPEQTGRMNRSIDYRTDLYSFGITLYKIFTGILPFTSIDPMELVHSHIAIIPKPPHEVNENIPEQISLIIMKLIAKTAEERYQTAAGVMADLKKCHEMLKGKGKIENFEVATMDTSEKFHIPEKLYGREVEIQKLVKGFERVNHGNLEFTLVSGAPGVGKSALINELHKTIIKSKGYFITGKFDQFKKNIPYASLIQAFDDLIHQLLTEQEESLGRWKEKLLGALKANAGIITNVIPDLELIIGEQPPVQELPPEETKNRFNITFQNFVNVFATKQHPLVIFLDDLQWSDAASLNLIKLFAMDDDTKYLYLIGTFRSNEVDGSHPLTAAVTEIGQAGVDISSLFLAPLDSGKINLLLCDTLSDDQGSTSPLAALIHKKTNGIPFFVNEFLKALYVDNVLSFNRSRGKWEWDIDTIIRMEMTENVVDLMTAKIKKFPKRVQETITLAACVGSRFHLHMLSLILDVPPKTVIKNQWEAIEEDYIQPVGTNYKHLLQSLEAGEFNPDFVKAIVFMFLHDRVQQAAYNMLPDDKKKITHLKIGRILLKSSKDGDLGDNIFDIVNHLNNAINLITDAEEKDKLAKLNFRAGKRAESANAYENALFYYKTGISLLPDNPWEHDYDFALDIYMGCSDCEYLSGLFTEAEKSFKKILNKTKTNLEKVVVYNKMIAMYQNMGVYERSVKTGIKALKLMGENFPFAPSKKHLLVEIIKIKLLMRGKNIEELYEIHLMTDEKIRAIISIFTAIASAAVNVDRQLAAYTSLRMLTLTLKHGNSDQSAFVYIAYGLILSSAFGDYESGYRYGKLGLSFLENSDDKYQISRCHMVFARAINHYKNHANTSLGYYETAFQAGIESGNLIFSSWSALYLFVARFIIGDSLETVALEIEKYKGFIRKSKYDDVMHFCVLTHRMILSLKGQTSEISNFGDDEFDEDAYVEKMVAECKLPFAVAWYYIMKSQACYLSGKYRQSLEYSDIVEEDFEEIKGILAVPEHYFYRGLSMAALYPTANRGERKKFKRGIKQIRKKLAAMTKSCPENFLHKTLLLDAELARIGGIGSKAGRIFENAIKSAAETRYIQNEAIANERAADFYMSKGMDNVAMLFMGEAYYAYRRWGATAKTRAIVTAYPDAVKQKIKSDIKTDSSPTTLLLASDLDSGTMMKALQTISGEIVLPSLLEKVLKIMVENAGAQRGVFIYRNKNSFEVWAEYKTETETVNLFEQKQLNDFTELPHSMLAFSRRKEEPVLVEDASSTSMFPDEPYFLDKTKKSILCIPVIQHGKLNGMLYFENDISTAAFTTERLGILTLLASQVSISVENARMYNELEGLNVNLEEIVEDRTNKLQQTLVKVEEANQHIMDSIEYAKKIQQALLPARQLVKNNIPNSFMIWEPRDIVGGDIVYLEFFKDHYILSVIDCTGHGVPGAFMTMISSTSIRRIIRDENCRRPDEILKRLNLNIKTLLKQDSSDAKSDDGLDGAICCVTPKDKKIEFAGARTSLFIMENGKVQEIKGDRHSIGYKKSDLNFNFTTHEIKVTEQTRMYMATDGIFDQLGGKKNFPFGKKRFISTLMETGHLPIAEQKAAIAKAFYAYSPRSDRLDDVTVTGFQI